MVVSKIEQLGKSRYQIFIDGKPSFVLYRGELRTYSIEEDKEISQETYDLILSEVMVKRARLRAMNLLMKHAFTVRQLRNKLSDGGYPDEIVDNAIEYVSSYGYIDDSKYAMDYISSHREDKSLARIKQDLLNKGIDKDVINQAYYNSCELDGDIDEEKQIKRLLEKRHYDSKNTTYEEKQKLFAYLARKGFGSDIIFRALKDY